MNQLFCTDRQRQVAAAETSGVRTGCCTRRFLPFTDTDAYRVMKAATEAFVIVNCGVLHGEPDFDDAATCSAICASYLDRRDLPEPGRERYLEQVDGIDMLPYLAIIRRKLPDVPIATGRRLRHGRRPVRRLRARRSCATPACSS